MFGTFTAGTHLVGHFRSSLTESRPGESLAVKGADNLPRASLIT